MDAAGATPLLDQLDGFRNQRRADVAGLVVMLERCAEEGPYGLPTSLAHDVGDGIREFIKGRLRLLYFVSDNAVVVCSHVFLKKTQKTPTAQVQAAVRLRNRYQQAVASNSIQHG